MELKIEDKPNTRFRRVMFIEGEDQVGSIDLEEQTTRVCLWSFIIYDEFQRRGFGLAAMKELINYLKGKQLWLYVRKNNIPALKIYKAVGFEVTNDSPSSHTYDMMINP